MNLERPNINKGKVSESPKQEIGRKEIKERFPRRLIECVWQVGYAGALAGAIFGGVEGAKRYEEHAYKEHLAHELSAQEMGEKEKLLVDISESFGDEAAQDIRKGDQAAFFERKHARNTPTLRDFEQTEEETLGKYVFTNRYLLWPKGWIEGEVGNIHYSKDAPKLKIGEWMFSVGGTFAEPIFYEKPAIWLYGEGGTSSKVIAHELGHANDWENDMDLNVLERTQLLTAVRARMESHDAFHEEAAGGTRYYENYRDGTRKGEYRAAREYWATICEYFFSDAKTLKERSPKDFELVQKYAQNNQADFNIFDEHRGAFDPQTGEVRDIWQHLEKASGER